MELKLTPSDLDLKGRYEPSDGYTMNMSILDAFKHLGVKDEYEFYDKLQELGFGTPLIVPTEADVADIRHLSNGCDLGLDQQVRQHYDILVQNLPYWDIPFEYNGKWGLRSTTGVEVVPPFFDECKGVCDILDSDKLVAVRKDGKWWLTPRDGSGKIINAVGYDYIDHPYHISRDGKCGVIDFHSGKEIIPCEMDWIIGDFMGKDNHVGLLYTEGLPGDMLLPTFDSIDLSTGQFCINGRWGWASRSREFTDVAPESIHGYWYVPRVIMLDHDANDYRYRIGKSKINLLDGVKPVVIPRNDLFPEQRLQLPSLKIDDIKVTISPEAEAAFANIQGQSRAITVDDKDSTSIIINASGQGIEISWTETDQMRMAEASAFPLIHACHRILSSVDGKLSMTFSITFDSMDLTLPKRFLSAWLKYKSNLNSLK